MMHRLLVTGLVFLVLPVAVGAQTLSVRHDHDPWGGCEGELEISEDGIRFEPDEGDHRREWAWIDIQSFDRRSPNEFSILTYEDLKWHLGQDRAFDFTVLPGETSLTDSAFAMIRENLARPVTDRIPMTIPPVYQVAVKHLHFFGGCEGILTFGDDYIVYAADHEEDARTWRVQDIRNAWSSGPFNLDLHVHEEDRLAGSKTSRFAFQLKEPLSETYYDQLRRQTLLRR